VIAPLTVAVCLLWLGSAPAVFVVYHLGLCLGLPLLTAGPADLGLERRGRRVGAVLGLAALAVPVAAFRLRPDLFPDTQELNGILAGWSLDGSSPGFLLLFMGLVNGPAEEVFWRGWLQPRLVKGPTTALALLLLFASYHGVTIGVLAPGPGAAVLMMAAVLAAGGFWMWTRRRWGSLWPALMSHAGASVGYTIVCGQIL
jgi:membrane protease YdiL (CAAX protease family)